jgi:hypothetical protein
MENGRATLTVLPARHDEGKMTVEPARTWISALGHEPADPNPAAHGVAGRTDTAGDLLGRHSLAMEVLGCLAALASQIVQL